MQLGATRLLQCFLRRLYVSHSFHELVCHIQGKDVEAYKRYDYVTEFQHNPMTVYISGRSPSMFLVQQNTYTETAY